MKLEKIGHLVTTDFFVKLKEVWQLMTDMFVKLQKISMKTFGFHARLMEKTADLLYKAFSQNDVRGASRPGRLIMQRYVASDGNTFEGVGV